MNLSARELYDEYSELHDQYQNQARDIEKGLAACINDGGVRKATVSARAKEPLELFKKQMRKNYLNPWSDCADIIGARVIVGTTSEKSVVVSSLQNSSMFEVTEIEDQEEDSDPSEMRYRGLHVHVKSDMAKRPDGAPMQCEVQIRTAAQHAWAETEHRFIYKKGEVPDNVKRHFNRLLVLIELFDIELNNGVEMARELDGFRRLELSQYLEVSVNQLTHVPGDAQLTMDVIEELESSGLGSAVELQAIAEVYMRDHSDELVAILNAHGPQSESHDVSSDWITTQGELILMLALLRKDEYQLSNALQHSDLYRPVEALAMASGHTGFLRD